MTESIKSPAVRARMNLSPAIPIFRVDNLDLSVAYYVDKPDGPLGDWLDGKGRRWTLQS